MSTPLGLTCPVEKCVRLKDFNYFEKYLICNKTVTSKYIADIKVSKCLYWNVDLDGNIWNIATMYLGDENEFQWKLLFY